MRHIAFVLTAVGVVSTASAQMTIREVGPGASYIASGLPGGGIAQGSFFYIKGTNLGPATGVTFTGPQAYVIGVDLAGTRVRVTIGPTVLDALPYYTSAGQVNAILPSNTPVGSGTVTVFYNGALGTYPITVVRAAYGIFTLNSAGSGPAVVTNNTTGAVITFNNVLHPGDNGVLWGTGLGAANFPDSQPAQLIRLESDVVILVGGKQATLQYAGRTPGLSGLDQINFVVPDGVSGCAVPIVVRVAGVASNFASVPIASSGSTCSDPGGLTAADLTAAQSGNFSFGFVSLTRSLSKGSTPGTLERVDAAAGAFERFDYNSLIRTNTLMGAYPGSCTVSRYRGASAGADPIVPTYLDAGPKLTLTGNGNSKDLNKSNGVYLAVGSEISGTNPIFLEPGFFTVAGTGGPDVGPFTVSRTLPAALTWTNQDAITDVPRNQNLHITFSGGNSSDLAVITGAASDANGNGGGIFTCYASGGAGSFDVPSYVLSALPISAISQGRPMGSLSVGGYAIGTRFNAGGINFGFFGYTVTNLSAVNYQ